MRNEMTASPSETLTTTLARTCATSRRRALLMLGAVTLATPARADGVPAEAPPAAPPVPAAPALPPSVAVPPLAPAIATPVAPPSPSRPAVAAGAIDKSKTYYLFFEQNIDAPGMRALRKQLTSLVEAGVTDITIVLNSAGGLVYAALATYSFIRALPATINMHAQGLVASAATVLFLAGQQRSADRNARFVFHPAQSSVAGSFNDQQLHDQLTMLANVEEAVAQIYVERTRLDDATIRRFEREVVVYTADHAREFDIVQTVGDLRIPGEQKARILFIE